MLEQTVDCLGQGFSILEEAVGPINIALGSLHDDGARIEWTSCPHREFDGLGALAEHLRRRGNNVPALPSLSRPAPPAGLSRCRLTLASFNRRDRGCVVHWRWPERAIADESAAGWRLFSRAETLELFRRSERDGVSPNSLLLATLNAAVPPLLAKPPAHRYWMVPVNMRGGVRLPRDTANHTAALVVKLAATDTSRQVHEQIRSQLARNLHWRSWFRLSLARHLPQRVLRKVVIRDYFSELPQIGTFSNLGVWPPANARLTTGDRDVHWLFCPPALRTNPIAAGAVVCQGRLGLMIRLAPQIGAPARCAQQCVDFWGDTALMSGKGGDPPRPARAPGRPSLGAARGTAEARPDVSCASRPAAHCAHGRRCHRANLANSGVRP
ncbi:MAG: hypothetical protein ACT4QC_12660 [Planctomycetaceae bacterium]